jgi:hypothetical protein
MWEMVEGPQRVPLTATAASRPSHAAASLTPGMTTHVASVAQTRSVRRKDRPSDVAPQIRDGLGARWLVVEALLARFVGALSAD